MKFQFSLLIVFFVAVFQNACVTRSIQFSTEGTATVSLVSWNNINETGQKLGETPISVELDKINGKIVKITQDGKIPQFWVLPNQLQGDSLKANITLADIRTDKIFASQSTIDPAQLNRMNRLLIRSVQALSSNQIDTAYSLADQLSKMPLATPASFIVLGLAQMAKGDRTAARASFTKAKALDPEDKDIDKLLEKAR